MSEELLNLQKKFQQDIGDDINSKYFRKGALYVFTTKITEFIDSPNQYREKKFRKKLIDIQILLINLILSTGLSYQVFDKLLLKTVKSNFKERQEEN